MVRTLWAAPPPRRTRRMRGVRTALALLRLEMAVVAIVLYAEELLDVACAPWLTMAERAKVLKDMDPSNYSPGLHMLISELTLMQERNSDRMKKYSMQVEFQPRILMTTLVFEKPLLT